jgi:small nuclear ribonucleoprotein G
MAFLIFRTADNRPPLAYTTQSTITMACKRISSASLRKQYGLNATRNTPEPLMVVVEIIVVSMITDSHVWLYAGKKTEREKSVSMVKVLPPELKNLMDKKLSVKMNAGRQVTGVLRGYDVFANVVLDAAVDEKTNAELGMIMVRGNSIITMQALEPVGDD